MKKKLRIALFFSSDPSKAGGVQEHIYYLAKELQLLGHTVSVFGPDKKNIRWNFPNYVPLCDIKKVTTPNGNVTNITLEYKNTENVVKDIEKSFDILHVHEPYIPFVSWKLLTSVDIPKVTTFHTAWNDDSIFSAVDTALSVFKKAFSRQVVAAIFVSELTQQRWKVVCNPTVLQRVIPHGVDKTFVPVTRKKTPPKVTLLFLARVVKRKGLQYLLKALSQLEKNTLSSIELIVVGNGDYLPSAKKLVKKLALDDTVKFVGAVYGKDRISYYQQAALFCAPYADEAFGMTVLEAMACGATIVGFKNGGFKSMLDEYPYPELLVPQQDVEALSEALRKAGRDSSMRKKAGTWAVCKSQEFSWRDAAKETEKVYLESSAAYQKH